MQEQSVSSPLNDSILSAAVDSMHADAANGFILMHGIQFTLSNKDMC